MQTFMHPEQKSIQHMPWQSIKAYSSRIDADLALNMEVLPIVMPFFLADSLPEALLWLLGLSSRSGVTNIP